MTKLDAGLITSLPASDSGSAAVWGSKRINPRPQSCLCLTCSGCPSNDDDDDDNQLLASSENCYISWRDFHDLYEEDTKQKAFLQLTSKIIASALHPGNNKQKVALTLAIFHETTIAAFKLYKPARKDAVEFLTLLSSWRAMINSQQLYNPNALGNAIVSGDGKN